MNKHLLIPLIVALAVTIISGILLSCNRQKNEHTSFLVHPDWSKNATIYEVNIRQYTPEGTFAAFEKHLPRLKEMGVDILWLMPINPIGEKNRKGSLGSYYAVQNYLTVNKEFGTLDDLKRLVNKAHELGMKVIIDWVANHTSWDNVLITEHPEWYQHDSSGHIKSPVKDWTDVAGLDYSHKGLRDYMTDALKYWIKAADIDGYRCDVACMLPISFWDEAVPKLKTGKPIFMLAECETPEIHDTAFDMSYSWDFYHLMNDIAGGKGTANQIDTLLKKEVAHYNPDAYRMRFTSNHDENSWSGTEYERMGDAARAMAVLTFTFPGMPLVYSGQEAAFNKRLRFFDKDTINWNGFILRDFYSTLIRMKKENTALWNGEQGTVLTKIQTNNDHHVYAFLRGTEGNQVLVMLNLTSQPQELKVKEIQLPGTFMNVFSGEATTFDYSLDFVLKPWEYRVYAKK